MTASSVTTRELARHRPFEAQYLFDKRRNQAVVSDERRTPSVADAERSCGLRAKCSNANQIAGVSVSVPTTKMKINIPSSCFFGGEGAAVEGVK